MVNIRNIVRLLLVLAWLPAYLAACRHTPDEEQVRQAIAAVAEAAEAGSAGGVGASLSEAFDGNNGSLDRRELVNMVRVLALRGEHIGVTMGPVTIEPRGERLLATFTVTLSSGSGRLLPDQLGIYQVESAWRSEDGTWRCYSAKWKRSM